LAFNEKENYPMHSSSNQIGPEKGRNHRGNQTIPQEEGFASAVFRPHRQPKLLKEGERRVDVRLIMTQNPQCAEIGTSLQEIAQMMERLDVGAIPVCTGPRLVGMVTDRDIVLRAVATAQNPSKMTAGDVITQPVIFAYEDMDTEEVREIMATYQVRRIPIVDADQSLVGIVSLADIAKTSSSEDSGSTLNDISEPNS
jgi:CBS domain-containing protein